MLQGGGVNILSNGAVIKYVLKLVLVILSFPV